jgi:hypothetical protein
MYQIFIFFNLRHISNIKILFKNKFIEFEKISSVFILLFMFLTISVITNYIAALTYPAWFDETVISDIAFHYTYEGIWQQDIYWEKMEAWLYGPIYFMLQKPIIEIFGFSPICLRAQNAVCAYLVGGLITLLLWKYTRRSFITLLIFLLFIIDNSINRSIVLGRFDMVVSLFSILGFYFACRYEKLHFIDLILAALFSSLAFLTSIRSLFLLPGTAFLISFYSFKNYFNKRQILINISLFMLIFLIPIFIWINSVGGLFHYINTILNSNVVSEHWGFSIIRDTEDYIFIPIYFLIIIRSYKHLIHEPRIIAILLTFITFTLFVKEVGSYRPLIIPYLYLSIGLISNILIINSHDILNYTLLKFAFILIFLMSSFSFSVRSIDILYVNNKCRDSKDLQNKLLNQVDSNSIVAADYEYFYLLKNKSKFFFPARNILENRIKLSTLPQYFILTGEKFDQIRYNNKKWFDVISNKYNLIGVYNCKVNNFSFEKYFVSRRNFAGTHVFKLR